VKNINIYVFNAGSCGKCILQVTNYLMRTPKNNFRIVTNSRIADWVFVFGEANQSQVTDLRDLWKSRGSKVQFYKIGECIYSKLDNQKNEKSSLSVDQIVPISDNFAGCPIKGVDLESFIEKISIIQLK
jgi:Ni,Fe-hydrogenase III small subunit